MQTVILCGGLGTRMKEETEFRPKALIDVGGKPILWHIMQSYMFYGHNEFVIALGYKGDMIRELFLNWSANMNDFSIDMSSGKTTILSDRQGDFKVTLVDTDIHDGRKETLTGARILKCRPYIEGDEFMVTYGDGVSDVNINSIIDFHHKKGKLGTLTGVHPQSRFGLVDMDSDTNEIVRFREKPILQEYISGGFMVFNKKALDYFTEEEMEKGLATMADKKELCLFPHEGFWKAVDTYKELEQLNKLWEDGRPWAVWEK